MFTTKKDKPSDSEVTTTKKKTVKKPAPKIQDSSPKLPILIVEDQVIAAKKAIAGMNSSRYTYEGTTYQADLQGNKNEGRYKILQGKFITNDLAFCQYMMNRSTPFPAIAVFDNTLISDHASKILGFTFAYICNLSIDELKKLSTQELKEKSDLTDSENRVIFSKDEIEYLQKNSIDYKAFLQSVIEKKEGSPFPLCIILYTDEKEQYGGVPAFMKEALHGAQNVTKVFPKSPDPSSGVTTVAEPDDFRKAMNEPKVLGISKTVIYQAIPKTQDAKLRPSLTKKRKNLESTTLVKGQLEDSSKERRLSTESTSQDVQTLPETSPSSSSSSTTTTADFSSTEEAGQNSPASYSNKR